MTKDEIIESTARSLIEGREELNLRMLQHVLHEAKKPFISFKADILNVSLPTMMIFPDGRIESKYSDDVEAHLAKIDAAWQEEAAWIMKKFNYVPPE